MKTILGIYFLSDKFCESILVGRNILESLMKKVGNMVVLGKCHDLKVGWVCFCLKMDFRMDPGEDLSMATSS